jgi:hypothetical protein
MKKESGGGGSAAVNGSNEADKIKLFEASKTNIK